MAYFFPGKKLGIGGLALIVYLSITPVCWILAKSFGRYLRRSEKFKLIGYYTLWALICEFWGLWYYLSLNSTPSMEGGSLYFVLAFTAGLDLLFMFLGVHFAGERMYKYFSQKYTVKNA